MQKVEMWGAVKVDHKVYRDNEILQLIGKPIANWEFAGGLPDDESLHLCRLRGRETRFSWFRQICPTERVGLCQAVPWMI